jgi:hypothetical protein
VTKRFVGFVKRESLAHASKRDVVMLKVKVQGNKNGNPKELPF